MVRHNQDKPKRFRISKRCLKCIYIIEGVAAFFLGMGCLYVFAQIVISA